MQKTTDKHFRFFKTYPLIQRFGWQIWSKKDALRFTQAGTLKPISYEYEKMIEIDENGLTVRRRLRNVG